MSEGEGDALVLEGGRGADHGEERKFESATKDWRGSRKGSFY